MKEKREIELESIIKNEPRLLSLNFLDISNERFDLLNTQASEIANYYLYFRTSLTDNKFQIVTIMDYYEFICRNINKNNGNLKLYNHDIKFNSKTEKELFIVLFTDPTFKYLDYYHNHQGVDNKDTRDQLIKMFGFYSMSLLRMELHAMELINSLKKERNCIDAKHSKIK